MRALRQFWLGEVDLAPLCVFRILYGLQLVNWVWQLYPNLSAFFTDEGILPRRALLVSYADRLTLLDLFGTWWQVAIFWVAALGVAAMLTVGWRSRLGAFLAFVVVSSFSWRDPLILDGSDFVFRVVPFWLMFTDCGARYSMDARRRSDRGEPARVRGFALPVRILELQVAWIYLATGLEKLAGHLWPSGLAAYYALQLEHTFGRTWASAISTNALFANAISYGTLAVELAFAPLAMVPSRVTRLLAVACAAGLHVGILALMNVGNFPVIMLSALVLFLPAHWVAEGAEAVRTRLDTRLLRPRAVAYADAAVAHRAVPRPRTIVAPRVSGNALERSVHGLALGAFALVAFATAAPSQLDVVRPQGDAASLLRFLSVDQRWDMFAPEPVRADGWMMMPATLADGTRLDWLTRAPVDNGGERYSDALYSRWVKVQERIASAAYADYRLEFGRSFCRARNLHLGPGESPLESFEIRYAERVIAPPGEPAVVPRDILLWSHQC